MSIINIIGCPMSICFRWFRLNRIQRGDIDFPVLQPGKLELMSLLYGETGMPEVNRMTKIELDSSVTLYRSSDLKLGEIITEIVTNVFQKDFRSKGESEPEER